MISPTSRPSGRLFVAALACVAVLPAAVRADQSGAYACPVLGSAIASVSKETKFTDVKGVRYYFCCDSCKPQFEKSPDKFLKDSKNKEKVIGAALFDPVTTQRIDADKAVAHSDVNGVRYFFGKADDKKAFDKEPKRFTAVPKKEVLFCPVSNERIGSAAQASDYSEVKGTRYYFCCGGCKPQFDKNPDKYLEGLEARMKAAPQKQDADKS